MNPLGFLIYFLEILNKKGKKWRELLADEYLFCFYFKVVPYTSGKIWSARLIFLFFGSVFEYIHCNKYQNFNKFQPTDSEL
jgi:hypothetical protein